MNVFLTTTSSLATLSLNLAQLSPAQLSRAIYFVGLFVLRDENTYHNDIKMT